MSKKLIKKVKLRTALATGATLQEYKKANYSKKK